MLAADHLQAGDPVAALGALQAQVRARPADAKSRIFLFQLLCLLGDWKRAVAQLKICAELDPQAMAMAQTYREAIVCEVYREKVFAGDKSPLVFGEPAEWMALLIKALKLQAEGRSAEAATLRTRAFDLAPALAGEINGAPFAWIADADMRFGPMLEAVINGRYFWLPFAAIDQLTLEPPTDLRDAVWMPAQIRLANGGDIVALIPTRYPGTPQAGAAETLARSTRWVDAGADTHVGLGQRVLATDAGDTALMDLRSLVLHREEAGDG